MIGIQQPKQRLAPTGLAAEEVPRNAIVEPSILQGGSYFRLFNGVEISEVGGAVEVVEGDCGRLLCSEYVAGSAFLDVPKGEDFIHLFLLGRVEKPS